MSLTTERAEGSNQHVRVAVMGSGGIGGYFGARLALGGADVGFVARGAHLEKIQRDGIKIHHGGDSFHVTDVRASEDPADLGEVDLVMVCVKLWDTEAALEQIRPIVGPLTTVVSFQNSVVKDSLLKEAFTPERVIGGVAYVAATIAEPGVITRTGPLERFVFGEFDGTRSERIQALYHVASAGGINAEISDDITRAEWEKFVFLVGLSATTTTIGLPIGPIRENPQTRAFLRDLMQEVVDVAHAHGVDLPDNYADLRLDFVDGVSPDMTSSMAHDRSRGNRLEVPWLSGAVVSLGAERGVATPLNRAISDVLALHAGGR